ncbi:hypothetical protein, partial [Serratia marcescens]|uniref:hypothetical protein n=1 Tax=Serratia marcescens TaxID=615 RepID=UPI001953C0AB
PDAIYKRPATPFALEFVGLSTRIAGTALEASGPGEVAVATDFGRIRGQGRFTPGSPVLIGVRPERMAFGAQPDQNTIR